ncbi:MAG: hypothetical protein AB1793_09790, partial [Candidatus Thermoplasmatota archaeon]
MSQYQFHLVPTGIAVKVGDGVAAIVDGTSVVAVPFETLVRGLELLSSYGDRDEDVRPVVRFDRGPNLLVGLDLARVRSPEGEPHEEVYEVPQRS